MARYVWQDRSTPESRRRMFWRGVAFGFALRFGPMLLVVALVAFVALVAGVTGR